MDIFAFTKKLLKDKTCLVGMGNYMRHDDAVGLYILDGIKCKAEKYGLEIFSVEDIIESYVFDIASGNSSNVLLIDAVESDHEPGSIVFGLLDELKNEFITVSSHKPDLAIVDKIFRLYNKQTYLIGITVENIEYGYGISEKSTMSADFIKNILLNNIQSCEKELVHEYK